jgi:hypothetical protein
MKKLLIAVAALTVAYSQVSLAAPGGGRKGTEGERPETPAEKARKQQLERESNPGAQHSREQVEDIVKDLFTDIGAVSGVSGKGLDDGLKHLTDYMVKDISNTNKKDSEKLTPTKLELLKKRMANSQYKDEAEAVAALLAINSVTNEIDPVANFLNAEYFPQIDGTKPNWKDAARQELTKVVTETVRLQKTKELVAFRDALTKALKGFNFSDSRIDQILCICFKICKK